LLSTALRVRWPQVCRVTITFTVLPTNRFVSTTKKSMKCVVPVKRWIRESGDMTFVGAPDAVILREAIKELRKRMTAGAATFLVKVKVHQGQLANAIKEANIRADNAISSKDIPMECHDSVRTNRTVFTFQELRQKGGTVSYEDRKSTWNSGVRKAIRRGSAEEEVNKHRDRVTGAWKQTSKQRGLINVS